MTIKKSEVHEALYKMEKHLFGVTHADNPNQPINLRLIWVFSAAYEKDYRPECSLILLNANKLLQTKGYYYEEE